MLLALLFLICFAFMTRSLIIVSVSKINLFGNVYCDLVSDNFVSHAPIVSMILAMSYFDKGIFSFVSQFKS